MVLWGRRSYIEEGPMSGVSYGVGGPMVRTVVWVDCPIDGGSCVEDGPFGMGYRAPWFNILSKLKIRKFRWRTERFV